MIRRLMCITSVLMSLSSCLVDYTSIQQSRNAREIGWSIYQERLGAREYQLRQDVRIIRQMKAERDKGLDSSL